MSLQIVRKQHFGLLNVPCDQKMSRYEIFFTGKGFFTPRIFTENLLELKKTVNNDILKNRGWEDKSDMFVGFMLVRIILFNICVFFDQTLKYAWLTYLIQHIYN